MTMALSASSYGSTDDSLHTPKFSNTTFDFSSMFTSKYLHSKEEEVAMDTTASTTTAIAEAPIAETSSSSLDPNLVPVKLPKYNLRQRSIKNRIETEIRRTVPVKKATAAPKPKQRPAPLSKYRRRTANARERERMQEINEAFEVLRKVVPAFPTKDGPDNTKLTKITTLKLAVNYIAALTKILDQADANGGAGGSDPSGGVVGIDSIDPSDLLGPAGLLDDSFDLILESDGDSLPLSDDITL